MIEITEFILSLILSIVINIVPLILILDIVREESKEEEAEEAVYNYLIEHYDYEDANTIAEDFSDCYNIEKVTIGKNYL